MKLKLNISKSKSDSTNIIKTPTLMLAPLVPKSPVHMSLPLRYKYIEILGQGAYGLVVKAMDTQSGNVVAIKLQKHDKNKEFEKEIENLKWVSDKCKNLVCILDHGTHYGKLYIVMEFIKGMDMDKYIHKNHGNKIIESLFKQLISAVKLLHSHGLAHMDIKPANVMVDTMGSVRLVDLGLSCFQEPCVGGTTKYIPPDVFGNPSVSERKRADMWAVGGSLAAVLGRNDILISRTNELLAGSKMLPLPTNLKITPYLTRILGLLTESKKRAGIFKTL